MRSITIRAFIVSVLLHVLVAIGTWNADFFAPSSTAIARAEAEPLELVLVPDEPSAAESRQPTAYTDVPERLAAEEPPERADFLALYNSRAADMIPEGQPDADAAAIQESPVQQVAIERERLESAEGIVVAPSVAATQTGEPDQDEASEETQEPPRERDPGTMGEYPLPAELEDPSHEVNGEKSQKESTPALPELVGGAPPSILKPGQTANAGDRGFDFDQIASGDVTGNVLQSGGYSLNTWEWNWAPWMQKFGQDIRRHWFAPYAYSLGVIDGMTRLEIVVERDGTCSSLEVQQTEGHESLEQSSVAAIRAAAPFLPLPRDFPEENLVIVLTLHYPAWKQLPPPRESQPQESDRTRRRR